MEQCLQEAEFVRFPALIVRAVEKATFRFVEFFAANIRHPNMRRAYGQAFSAVLHLVRSEKSSVAPAQSCNYCRLHCATLRRRTNRQATSSRASNAV